MWCHVYSSSVYKFNIINDIFLYDILVRFAYGK